MASMKKLLIAAALVLSVGCSNKDENEARTSFYLSQPRDPALVGWWKEDISGYNSDGTAAIFYTWFKETGTVVVFMRDNNGTLDTKGSDTWYWYAKEGVYHTFDRNDSAMKGRSPESATQYEIRGDELWVKDVDTWQFSKKRTTPKQ